MSADTCSVMPDRDSPRPMIVTPTIASTGLLANPERACSGVSAPAQLRQHLRTVAKDALCQSQRDDEPCEARRPPKPQHQHQNDQNRRPRPHSLKHQRHDGLLSILQSPRLPIFNAEH